MDKEEFVWRMYQEDRNQARHHEVQRSSMSNLILAISGGILGLLTISELDSNAWPLSIMLALLGIFGAMFSAKQYERFCLHYRRAIAYRKKLEDHFQDIDFKEVRSIADSDHQQRAGVIHPLRLHWFGIALHILVACLGFLLIILLLVK